MLVLICWANTIHGPNLLHMAPPRQVTAALLIRLIKICKGEELGGRPMLWDRSGNWSSTTPFVSATAFESAFKISSLLNTALNGKQKCHPNKRLQKASSWSISSQQKYDRVKKKSQVKRAGRLNIWAIQESKRAQIQLKCQVNDDN